MEVGKAHCIMIIAGMWQDKLDRVDHELPTVEQIGVKRR